MKRCICWDHYSNEEIICWDHCWDLFVRIVLKNESFWCIPPFQDASDHLDDIIFVGWGFLKVTTNATVTGRADQSWLPL